MKIYKCCTFIVILMLLALHSKAQLPLRGTFYITGVSEIPSNTSSSYSIEGRFTDPTFTYSSSDVQPGDNVVDNGGIVYKIDKIRSLTGNVLTVDVTYVRGASDPFFAYPTAFAAGVLFRPTPNGYALGVYDPENNSEVIKTAIQNSAIVDIDRDIRGFKSGTTVPEHPKFGDIFYNVTEKKLYAFTDNGWVPLGSGVIASGTVAEFPNPAKAGEMYLNKDDNNTYIYNGALWFKISTNGSTPSANVNPDPLTAKVKEGDLFYNTSDHRLYVYNGTAWMTINNTLRSGQIFVGNASNVVTAVTLSGDATLTNAGKLAIKNQAVTDEKLDKLNIPLNGFGAPLDNVAMGDGSTNFRITNLATPSDAFDAVNRDYVDKLLTTPGTLALPLNNFFIGNSSDKAIAIAKNLIPISGFARPGADVLMGAGIVPENNFRIINLRDPGAAQDAATKNYVDTRPVLSSSLVLAKGNIFVGGDGDKATSVAKTTVPLNTFGAPLDAISMAGFKLTNLGDPVTELDAVNKKYVDNKVISPGSIPLTKDNFLVGDANGKAADVLKSTIPLSGFGPAAAPVSLNGFKLTNLAAPEVDEDASTKKYVDDLFKTPADLLALPKGNFFIGNATDKAAPITKGQIPLSGFGKATDDIYMGDNLKMFRITLLRDPQAPQDAATRNYVDNAVSNTGSLVLPLNHVLVGNEQDKAVAIDKGAIPLSDFGAALKDLSLGSNTAKFKIVNLKNPDDAQDAATKDYVDSRVSKSPVGPTAPANPVAGDTYYNTTDNHSYVYNGTAWVPTDNKLKEGEMFVGNAAGIAVSTDKGTIPLSGFDNAKKNISLGDGTTNFNIVNLKDPVNDQEAATKKYVDSKTTKTGATAPANPVAGDTYYNTTDKHFYVYDGKQWVTIDSKIELKEGQLFVGDASGVAVSTDKGTIPLSGFDNAKKNISLGDGITNFNIVNLKDPANDQEAATKKYVDSKTTKTGATAPANPVIGDTYYNTTDKRFYVYNGTAWVAIDTRLAEGQLFVGDASGVAVSTDKGTIPLSGFDNAKKNISLGDGITNFNIVNLKDPANDQEAATKKYVDSKTTKTGATAPANPVAGDTYYNTTDKHLYVFNGTEWVAVDIKDNLGNHKATQNISLAANAISNDGAAAKGLSFETSGNAILAQDLTVNGNLFTPSDRRLKTNIETLTSVLQKIDQLRGVKFQYIDQHKYAGGNKIGVIAQELQQVYPEMVTQGKDGFLKVDYTQLTGILIQAVKEQQAEINALKARMDQQQEQINSILQKIK